MNVLLDVLQVVPGITLLVWAPLCSLPLLVASLNSTRYLAACCIAGAIVQHVSVRHQRQRSSRVI